MEYKYPLTAINKNGKTVMLYNIKDVGNFKNVNGWWGEHWTKRCAWYGNNHGNHPSIPWNWNRHTEPVHYDWIVRDEWGRVVKPTDFYFNDNARWKNRLKVIRHAEALGLPIPGCGHARNGYSSDTPAKKNGGKGQRNRTRAVCAYEFLEYGVKNKYGKVQPWEGY